MDLNTFSNEICPLAMEALKTGQTVPESEKSSEVMNAEFTYRTESYSVITQNTKKTSKFSKLAQKGHKVAWVINSIGMWYLMVNGKIILKDMVTQDGDLIKGD